jgi:hypothetical protein
LAGRRLRAQHASGRHGDLLLSAGDANAHAYSDGDTISNANGHAYTYAEAHSDAASAPNTASAADAAVIVGDLVNRDRELAR